MFFEKMLRYLFGFVRFSVSGGFAERFINLCDSRSIKISDIKYSEKALFGYVSAKDYKRLRSVSKISGMKLKAISKHGLPFLAFKYRNRVGLLIGAVFFAVFLSSMTLFVWTVDTVGSKELSREEILSVAGEYGLKVGAFKPKIDVHELSDKMITKMNGELLWCAVNLNGCHALVEVRDYTDKPESQTYGKPCNIVADFSGLLLSIEVHAGKKANREGNGVEKGDLLISGIIERRDTSSFFREARGKITALHKVQLKSETKNRCIYKRYVGKKSVYSLKIFHLRIPLGYFSKAENYSEYSQTKSFSMGNKTLPFSIVKTTRVFYESSEEESDFNYTSCFDDFTQMQYERFKNTNVLSTKLKIEPRDDSLYIESNSKCIDFMGTKQMLNVEN